MTSHLTAEGAPRPHARHPVFFEEFFDLGLDETKSPFLKPESRAYGGDLSLKASFLGAFLLLFSFIFSFYEATLPLSRLALVGVYFFAGIPSLIESVEDLLNIEVNIDVLMTLAAFSSVFIGSGMEGGLLLVLFSLSHSMESAVRAKAKGAISSLNKMTPTTAHVIEPDGKVLERSVKDVRIGTQILVKAGQLVPLDGKVLEGSSSVNLSHITGESLPLSVAAGDKVASGARNIEGALTVEVTRTSADSTLARIIQLVTQAQEARPKLQLWFDRLSSRYALAIILFSALMAATLPLLLGIPFLGLEGSLYRALAFLIAASPCALIIAIPIAYLSAVSVCARNGILLKGGVILDALANCKVVAFDKTGTLTTGLLTCRGIEGEGDAGKALAVAAAMERGALHPIAKAILNEADKKGVRPETVSQFKSIPGHGLQALYEGKEVFIGHPEFIAGKLPQKEAEQLMERGQKARAEGELVAVLLMAGSPYLFRFEDAPRPKVRRTLKALREKHKMQLLMLTGDHEESARRIAKEMGIDHYEANLRPENKLERVSALSEEMGLAMVGDGVNDAPALTRASVGIGMGKAGSTAAIDASDVVLLQDNIELLDWLMAKAHSTRRIVGQNLAIAVSAIIIASFPALAGLVPLWLAVILHEGGTVLVGLNALRLLRK